jgi:8-oxo-dGTP diphosphatase
MRSLRPALYASILARNLRAARAAANLSQTEVGERMRDLGFTAWMRSTVSLAEQGKRRLTAEEVFWLAYVVDVSVTRLASPTEDDNWIAAPNGGRIHAQHARERMRSTRDGAIRWERNKARFMADVAGFVDQVPGLPAGLPQPSQEDQLPSVATAIVTSSRGVLVGRRNDGKPPWTFIAGEVEEGETPEFAATREVKEETGLEARARDEIGRRVHPRTGREMIYIAAEPVRPDDLEVFVGDVAELAEVRWVSLAEADELMAAYGMFEPVREYLAREIGEG